MNAIRKAERKKAKLRLGICSPSGAGKTYSALLIAQGLGKKIGMIDTEAGSGEMYSHLCDYSVITIPAPFDPKFYIEAIHAFEKENYDVIIIDSLSHAWAGEGGLLDKHGKIADSGKGNSYTAWRTITPMHNQLIDAMLQSPAHVIATMRSKVEYVLEENEKGQKVPRKVGMAPIQREGMDFEMTVVFDLDYKHVATVSKDRTSLLDGTLFIPSKETGETLLKWLNSGKDAPVEKPQQPTDAQLAPKQPPPTKPVDGSKSAADDKAFTKKCQRVVFLFEEEAKKIKELDKKEYDMFRLTYIEKVLGLSNPVLSSKSLTDEQIDKVETFLLKDADSVKRFYNLVKGVKK